MKHTKGELKVSKSGHRDFDLCIVAEDGGSICHMSRWPEAKANAILFSAAPDMYKVLNMAMSLIIKSDNEELIMAYKMAIKKATNQ